MSMLKSLLLVAAAALLLGACEQPASQAAAPAQRTVQPGQMSPMAVYFDTGSSTLSQQAMASIRQVAADYKAAGNAIVTLTGHTDTVGTEAHNTTLAQR